MWNKIIKYYVNNRAEYSGISKLSKKSKEKRARARLEYKWEKKDSMYEYQNCLCL